MKRFTGWIIAGLLAAGAAQAAAGDARPAAFNHRLPAEHTVEVKSLPGVDVVTVGRADPVSLMRHAKVLVTKSAIAKIEEVFA